jgi:hypothetical protein
MGAYFPFLCKRFMSLVEVSVFSGSITSMWHVFFGPFCLLGLWYLTLGETLQNFINKHIKNKKKEKEREVTRCQVSSN